MAILVLWGGPAALGEEDALAAGLRPCHLLQRATFGATPADLARLERQGARRWLQEQLSAPPVDPDLEARLRMWPHYGRSARDVYVYQYENQYDLTAEGERDADSLPVLDQLIERRLLCAVESRYQLREMLVEFWFNHFNVFWDKGDKLYWGLPRYVEQVIRPRALGKFRDLLGAVAHSPTMLVYLDNWSSSATEEGGLNENYARELLELHTVGVEAGYTQADVVDAARCLAGWTMVDRGEGSPYGVEGSLEFRYDPGMHDPGRKRVMDLVIPPGGGLQDGERLLDYVASHPATARRISEKLARRFVDDDPPAALVERAARVFQASDGDLARVVECLLTSPEFYRARYFRSKMKTPIEVVASTMRVLDIEPRPGMAGNLALQRWPWLQPAEALAGLGAPQFQCLLPVGYPDRKEDWDHSGSLHRRLAFALGVARGYGPQVLAQRPGPEQLVRRVVPAGVGPDTRAEVDAAGADGVRILAVLLSSPEFQKR